MGIQMKVGQIDATANKRSRTSFTTGQFVAWDGEGADINGKHEYILLRCSTGDYISNTTAGLDTRSCLICLTTIAKQVDVGSIMVCYGASYDVNMIVRDLPREALYKLWTTGKVLWSDETEQPWILEYRHRKHFKIRKLHKTVWRITDKKTGKKKWNVLASCTLWDVLGFFQCPFIEAIKEYLADYDAKLLSLIQQRKMERQEFQISQLEDINYYCSLEIDALVQIMNKVRDAGITAGLQWKRWDGAGAIAESLLQREGVKAHQNKSVPGEVKREAWKAYSGGRIEVMQYGRFDGPIYHYDINSAYPTACLRLPTLSTSESEFHKTTIFTPNSFGVWRVHWDFDTDEIPFYPFFYRSKEGNISYPKYGTGFYWTPEVQAALQFASDKVKVEYGYCLLDTCRYCPVNVMEGSSDRNQNPFGFIPRLFAQRAAFKREGNAAQKVLKLGLNSLYGKLAQQVGGRKEWDSQNKVWKVHPPAYQQIEWAGYITSYTRATLYKAAMLSSCAIVMFSTDGIFSTTPLDVSIGKGLGEWERQVHDELIIAQSGVYWYRDGETWTSKYRGFDQGQLRHDDILDCWKQGKLYHTANSTRFVTMGAALSSDYQWSEWRQWITKDRRLELSAYGTKRMDVLPCDDYSLYPPAEWQPHIKPQRTIALISEDAFLEYESAPYKQSAMIDDDDRVREEMGDAHV